MNDTIRSRFEAKYTKTENCWLWNAAMRSTGYGAFNVDGKCLTASRVAYELYNGPIPEGLWVLHKCDNPRCVNPDHLFLGNNQDNVDDRIAKGRRAGRKGALTQEQYDELVERMKLPFKSFRQLSFETGYTRSTLQRIGRGTYTLTMKDNI